MYFRPSFFMRSNTSCWDIQIAIFFPMNLSLLNWYVTSFGWCPPDSQYQMIFLVEWIFECIHSSFQYALSLTVIAYQWSNDMVNMCEPGRTSANLSARLMKGLLIRLLCDGWIISIFLFFTGPEIDTSVTNPRRLHYT